MEDVFDAAWREHPASHDTQVDAELASLIDVRGLALLDDPKLLRQLLLRACPDAQRHVGALLAALTADVPKRLVASKDDDSLPALLRNAIRHLQEQAGLDAEWATWAVRTWAHAFALPTSVLDGPSVATLSPSFASSIASARPTRSDGFDHHGAGTIAGLWDRSPVTAIDPQPTPREAREPTLRNTDAFAPSRSEPGFSVAAAAAPSVSPGTGGMAAAPPVADRSNEPDVDEVAADEPLVAPAWDTHRPAQLRTRSMAGPVVMVVVVLAAAAIAWFALEGTPWSPPPTRIASSAPTSPVGPVTPPAAAPQPTQALPTRPTEADAPRSDAAPADPAAAVASPAAGAAPVTPPEEAPRTASAPESPPVDASPPKPIPLPRPVIARVDVPSIVEGAPFVVGLQLGSSLRDVASIERRVVDSGGAWPKLPTRFQASGLQRGSDRTLLIPFRAMDAPSRAIVEFTAVARDGTRSESKRVAISLDQPDPAVAALQIPAACTSATCGVVIEAREIEPEVGTRGAIYQLTVRMDDQQTMTSTAPYRLQIGSRARLAGTRLVPADRRTP